MSLEELQHKRLRWVEVSRENNFEEGIKNLLTDLYPDNAHFIYELLQNAEDAGATTCRFAVTSSELVFEHDGSRMFDLKDIDSITSIAASTKKDDETQIGKFGVGFKAVFAYTKTPRVQSGEFDFYIEDLVVPRVVGDAASATPSHTRFIIPFDNPDKPRAVAAAEVRKALSDLEDTTLLFLNSISAIEHVVDDGSPHVIRRVEHDDRRITIERLSGADAEATSWLRLRSSAKINGEGAHTVAAAFRLTPTDGRGAPTAGVPRAGRERIEPIDRARVSIFFPTAKETSGLRFHIHAPFASTVARDSVRDVPENRALIQEIAQLVAAALPEMVSDGLMNDGLLAALPNSDDALDPQYEPIRRHVVSAFSHFPITPGLNGGHYRAGELRLGPTHVHRALSDADLHTLVGIQGAFDTGSGIAAASRDTVKWARRPERPPRSRQMIESLGIRQFSWSELAHVIQQVAHCDMRDSHQVALRDFFVGWVQAQTDDALRALYALIGEMLADHMKDIGYRTFGLGQLEVIRVRGDEGTQAHLSVENALLPANQSDRGGALIKQSIWDPRSEDSAVVRNLKWFFDGVGVKKWDESEKLRRMLEGYPKSFDEHLAELPTLMAFAQKDPGVARTWGQFAFIRVDGADGSQSWGRPADVLVDLPYAATGFRGTKSSIAARAKGRGGALQGQLLSSAYSDHVEAKVFRRFLEVIGTRTALVIEEAPVRRNPEYTSAVQEGGRSSAHGLDTDWTIVGLEALLENAVHDLRVHLWSVVSRADRRFADAEYRLNGSSTHHRFESQLVQILKGRAWVPDMDGIPRRPGEIGPDQLHQDLKFDAKSPLLAALKLGSQKDAATKARTERDELARRLGLGDAATAAALADAYQKDSTALLAKAAELTAPELPESHVPDQERRAEKVRERQLGSPLRRTEIKERAVEVEASAPKESSKQYLREQYCNSDGEMVCQGCRHVMPFKVGDQYYFEAVQFIQGRKRHSVVERLALCPLCAAKYQHANETPEELRVQLVLAKNLDESTSSADVAVVLAGREVQLYFTGKHIFDLQASLGDE